MKALSRAALPLLLLLAVVTTAQSRRAAKHQATPSRVSQESAIREAVFRYQFHQADTWAPQAGARRYFISINGKDPSRAFVRRFRGHWPRVRPRSQSTRARGRRAVNSRLFTIMDRKSGAVGMSFDVGLVTWKAATEVEIKGSYRAGPRFGSGHIYRAARERGRWVVKHDQTTIIL